MAKFTSNVTINTRWRNNDFIGVAGSSHTFPDAFYDEFLIDWKEQLDKGNLVITETPTTGKIQMSTLTVGDIVLTGTATGNFGGGGSGNSTVYYQTTQPTGGTYAAGDLWVDSDAYLPSPGTSSSITVSAPIINSGTSTNAALSIQSASITAAGVVQLTDSTNSTSTTTAATPASVKLAFDAASSAVSANNFHLANGFLATTIETISRYANALASVSWVSSGRTQLAMFTPVKNLTVGTASFYCTATPTTTTVARMGLYTWNESTGTATLVAQTANDTTLFSTATVIQSRAFDTTGGFPSTYTLVAGSTYAFGMIFVGTGLPSALGLNINAAASSRAISPRSDGHAPSQTDLATVGSLSNPAMRIWGRFS